MAISPLWKRVIAWERSRAASAYGIVWGKESKTNMEEFSAECHSVDSSGDSNAAINVMPEGGGGTTG